MTNAWLAGDQGGRLLQGIHFDRESRTEDDRLGQAFRRIFVLRASSHCFSFWILPMINEKCNAEGRTSMESTDLRWRPLSSICQIPAECRIIILPSLAVLIARFFK